MPIPSFLLRLRVRVAEINRRWWLLSLVLILGAVGGWIWLRPEAAPQTQSVTQTVSRGTFKTTVAATGTITPVKQADLSFSSAGAVTAVAVAVGDVVKKGDLLARIDTATLIAQRDAAQAQVTAAQTQLSEDGGSSSAQLASNQAALAAAESKLAQADQAVDAATLTAPFAGRVSAVGISVGDQVGAGQTQSAGSGAASASISLITPKRLLIEANVSASDVTSLKKGLQSEITPTGGGDVVYGTVAEVGVIAGAADSGAAQFPVTIQITGTPTGLYPGATATVAITTKQATDVLTVPSQALRSEDDGSTYVYVVAGEDRTKATVTLGESYGTQTEVLSGLNEGDTVEVLSFTRPAGSGTTRTNDGAGFPGGGIGRVPGGRQGTNTQVGP